MKLTCRVGSHQTNVPPTSAQQFIRVKNVHNWTASRSKLPFIIGTLSISTGKFIMPTRGELYSLKLCRLAENQTQHGRVHQLDILQE
uniref:Uncharacterized protein n=1 Tax=Hyaloperonospora arabidopsidis (strain Emoy2) TaxID=559515 RepID=M4BSK9_HYAAE